MKATSAKCQASNGYARAVVQGVTRLISSVSVGMPLLLLTKCLSALVLIFTLAPAGVHAADGQFVPKKAMWQATARDYCADSGDGKVTYVFGSTAQGAAAGAMAVLNKGFACVDQPNAGQPIFCGPRVLTSVATRSTTPDGVPSEWNATGYQLIPTPTDFGGGHYGYTCRTRNNGVLAGDALWRVALCPANSKEANATICQCDKGFLADGGECVKVQTDAPQSCPRSEQDGLATKNPIIPATGEKIRDEVDYADSGPHPLNFLRHYRGAREAAGAFNRTWSHDYTVGLQLASNVATVSFGNGNVRTFTNPAASGSSSANSLTPWPSATGQGSLIPQSSAPGAPYTGWQYTNPEDDSVWSFDAAGKALSQTLRNGWVTSYTYNASNQLTQVRNQFGRSLAFTYNSSGQLTSVTTPDSGVIGYGYDSAGRFASVTYPSSTGTSSKSYLYENATFPEALTGIVDEAGQRSTYVYDSLGRGISSALAGDMDRYQVSYGSTASTVIDPLGTARTYSYATQNGKLAVTGANLPSGSGGSDASSRTQDTNGLITQETDFLGVQTMYTWDITRRLPLQTTQAAGRPEAQTTRTHYHPTFRLPALVTEAGRSTAYIHDVKGNVLSQTITDTATGQSRVWQWTYLTNGLADSMTDPKGGVWRYTYDAQGMRTTAKNPLNHITQYAYDAAGRLIQETAPNGLVTSYSYDQRGRLLSSIAGNGTGNEATIYSYTPTGQLARAVLPSGYQVSYSYDPAQRLIGAADNRGNSTSYTLDAAGNRLREEVKDPSGALAQLTSRIINNLNRVAAVQGASGQTTALGYDANGQATSQTDPLNQTTRQTLDGLRRPVATTFADNAQTSQSYNALDQLAQVTDPKGIPTSYQRNAFGEVTQETSPDTGSISYQRDALGDITGKQDAKGNNTQITRDALGRPLEVRYSQNNIARYIWDQGGLTSTGSQTGYLARIEDNSGTTAYERDLFGRITAKTQQVNDNPSNPGSFKTAYTYSTGVNTGQLVSITYPSGLKVIYNRSASGQIVGISSQAPYTNPKKPTPVTPFVSNLSYTALGQPKSWSWTNGDSAARSFDLDARMTANEFASYTFDANSRITGISQNLWASKTVTQVIGTSTVVVSQLYQTPLSWQASYDSRNRIVGFDRPGSSTGFTYDANSNRLSSIDKTTSDTDLDGDFDQADFTQTSSQALNVEAASNKLLGFTQTLTKVKGSKTQATTTSNVNYALDQNANLTNDGLRTFEYDEANRLSKVKVSKDGEAASMAYLYNALGQRVFKGEPKLEASLPNESTLGASYIDWLKKNFSWLFAAAQTNTSVGTAYSYADAGQTGLPEWALLGEYDNGSAKGAGRSEYIWLPTEDGGAMPIGMYRNSKFFAVHGDHLGTPRLVTNDLNVPIWQWPYSAFGSNKPTGVLKATPNPRAAITNNPVLLRATGAMEFNLRFPGQYADEETGTFYNYFRNYLPNQGRFSQSDPVGMDGGWNRFGYADGDAINGFDPYGLAACQVTFPNMSIDTGLGFSSTSLGGHGGILTYDNSGATQYSEYGRYPASQATGVGLPAGEGNVRRVGVPNLKLDKNGQPTPESLAALKKALEDKAGKGTNADLSCDANADEKKIRDYIKKIAEDANRAKYSWKPWNSNQCRDFASRAFNAGR